MDGFGLVLALSWVITPAPLKASDSLPLKSSYRLGVFPYLPPLTIDRLYGPVAEAFSFELDRLVKLRTKDKPCEFCRGRGRRAL